MRVVLISPFSMSGGGSTRIRDLIKDSTLDWRIILPKKDKYGGSPVDDPKLYFPINKKSILKHPLWCIKTILFLLKFKPDVVHSLKPHPFTVHPGIIAKYLLGSKMVFDCDEWDPQTLRENNESPLKILVSEFEEKIGLYFSDVILFANHHVLEEKIPKKYHHKCHYIPNGVDVDKFKNTQITHEGFRIHFVGRLTSHKNIDIIINSMEKIIGKIPDIKCIVIGDGPGLANIKKEIKQKNLEDYFELKGYIPQNLLIPELSTSDLFIAPLQDSSSIRYQCNMKIFEYMGLGRPIVASDVGEIKQIIGDSGVTYPADKPEELAKEITTIYSDKNLAELMGERARKLAEEKYDWKIISKDLVKAYGG